MNDEEFNRINPYHEGHNAYACFYDMMIGKMPLYSHLDALYKHNSISVFMDEAYQFMVENEEEIRNQMPNRGVY